jgi:hypothetical protein
VPAVAEPGLYIRELGQNFIRKFTIQNTDTRFHKMYELIFSSEQENKVNIENWQKKLYFRSTKLENEFINVRKKNKKLYIHMVIKCDNYLHK